MIIFLNWFYYSKTATDIFESTFALFNGMNIMTVWLLGNLARATYVGSSDWMWPFSYDTCDMARVEQQEINACRKVGHYGMSPGVGRGAPEIDILEAMGGEAGPLPNTPIERPYFSSSLQVR